MGLISTYIAYRVGKRRGRRATTVAHENDGRDPECLNFHSFCKSYGSCNGMTCEYEQILTDDDSPEA